MIQVNYLVIVIASVVAFLLSALYYFGFNKRIRAIRRAHSAYQTDDESSMSSVKVIVELMRTFVLAVVIAYAGTLLNLWFINQALIVAVWLWVGFPLIMLVGAVVHEKFPVGLAVIHAGDWLIKLILLCVVFTAWR